MSFLSIEELERNRQAALASGGGQSQQPQGTSGRGGFLTSLISEGAGTGGAIGGAALGASLGSVVPGLGTLIGGGIGGLLGGFAGGFGGRAVENKVRDDEFRLEDALNEGLLSGAFGSLGGLGHGFKAGQALKGIDKLDDVARAASGLDDLALGTRATTGQIKQAINVTKGGGKIAGLSATQAKRAKDLGIKQGTKVNGRLVTPKYTKQILKFVDDDSGKYVAGGVKTGSPQAQANSIQEAFEAVAKQKDALLQGINRPLQASEKAGIKKAITTAAKKSPSLGDDTGKNLSNLLKQIDDAADLVDIEDIRKVAQDAAYNKSGSLGTASAAKQSGIVRGAIDDFVTNLSDDGAKAYKASKGHWSTANDLLELASKNTNQKGFGIPLFGTIRAPVTGASAKLGKLADDAGGKVGSLSNALSGLPAKELARGTVGRGVANQFMGLAPGDNDEQQAPQEGEIVFDDGNPLHLSTSVAEFDEVAKMLGIEGDRDTVLARNAMFPGGVDPQQAESEGGQEGSFQGVDPREIQQMMIQDLQTTGGKNISELMKILEVNELIGGSGAEALTGDALKNANNAQSGLDALSQIQSSLSADPSSALKASLPNPFGLTAALTGSGSHRAAQTNLADVIGRLRSGAAINEDEEARFLSLLPQAFDDDATIAYKYQQLQSLLSPIANQGASPNSGFQLAEIPEEY